MSLSTLSLWSHYRHVVSLRAGLCPTCSKVTCFTGLVRFFSLLAQRIWHILLDDVFDKAAQPQSCFEYSTPSVGKNAFCMQIHTRDVSSPMPPCGAPVSCSHDDRMCVHNCNRCTMPQFIPGSRFLTQANLAGATRGRKKTGRTLHIRSLTYQSPTVFSVLTTTHSVRHRQTVIASNDSLRHITGQRMPSLCDAAV